MFYLASFQFRAIFIFCSACPFVVQANLFADCTFGDVQSASKSAQNMSFSGQLPSSKNTGHSCLVQANNRDGLLYLRAKRYNRSKGSLHVSVYGTEEAPFQLGHLDISRSTGWNSLPVCPSSLTNEASRKYLTFTGTSGLSFSVEIIQEETIKLDEQKEVTINQWSRINVFQFIPTEDISDKQLDVTVTSESADVPAYLKVSRNCKDVKDNIDVVDYKGESLRLSFAKKGRITLSKFSIPPLTDSNSSWFIGIAINNASGNISFDATKTVKLTLTRSFDYKYSKPFNSLVFVSLGVGILVSLWAWFSFKFRGCPCTADESLSITRNEFCKALWTVLSSYSFGRGHKTYSYITFIVGSVLMVGAFQFVFADWYLMIQEGDRDHCYYNDFCYRVRYYDIPYNLMVSNVAYIIQGLILALNVLFMESDLLARCSKLAANDDKRRHDVKSAKVRPYQNKSVQIRPDQNKSVQISPDQNKSVQIRPDQNKSVQIRPDQIESVQIRPDQNKSVQTRPDQNKSVQIRPDDQIEPPQTEPDYEDLPNHVLVCPDISPHLEKMLVPRYSIKKLKEKKVQKIFAGARKKRFTFTIGYALAWALTFEGFFSSLYHLCPRRLTFQFDTSFMFVIASLIVILFYNGIETKECSQARKVTDHVGAANFFLYFMVPLYYFNYLGTMYHSEAGLTISLTISFCVLLGFWCLFMIWWASYKLYPEKCSKFKRTIKEYICKKEETSGDDSSKSRGDPSKSSGDSSKSRGDSSKSRGDSSKSRDDSSKSRGDSSKSRGDSSKSREDSSNSREDSSNSREDSSNSREDSSNSRNDSSNSSDDSSNSSYDTESRAKCVNAICYFFGLWIVPIIFVILLATEIMDFPKFFLYTCFAENIVIIINKSLVKIINCNCCQSTPQNPTRKGYQKINGHNTPQNPNREGYEKLQDTPQNPNREGYEKRQDNPQNLTRDDYEKPQDKYEQSEKIGEKKSPWCTCVCSVAYVIFTFIFGIAAMVFFDDATTNKVKTPEKSRDLNKECYLLDFFDHHDIWHILSSFTLLMGALLVLHVSYEPPQIIQSRSTAGNSSTYTKSSSSNKTQAYA